MLPAEFQWHPYIDGDALRYQGHMIAFTSRKITCCLAHINPGLAVRRQQWFSTENFARRYIEAWARKWETEIRQSYRPVVVIEPPPPRGHASIEVVSEWKRRRGSNRNWFKKHLVERRICADTAVTATNSDEQAH